MIWKKFGCWYPYEVCCSVAKSCLTPFYAVDCSMPSFTVLHYPPELLKLTSIESVMPSNHLILCYPFSCPQFFPASGSFPMSWLFPSGGQSIGASTSASVLPMKIQSRFLLGLTGLISMLSNGLLKVFSNTTVQKHQFFGTRPSLWSSSHIPTWLLKKS